MIKTIALLLVMTSCLWFGGCITTPDSVVFDGESVGTFSVASGCNKLGLDEDCSGMTGATREISIDGLPLRAAGGDNGRIVFLMSDRLMVPDEGALRAGAIKVKNYLEEKGIQIIETKVMYSNETLAGVHYRANGDAYAHIKDLTVGQ